MAFELHANAAVSRLTDRCVRGDGGFLSIVMADTRSRLETSTTASEGNPGIGDEIPRSCIDATEELEVLRDPRENMPQKDAFFLKVRSGVERSLASLEGDPGKDAFSQHEALAAKFVVDLKKCWRRMKDCDVLRGPEDGRLIGIQVSTLRAASRPKAAVPVGGDVSELILLWALANLM